MAFNPISLNKAQSVIASLSPSLWIDVGTSFRHQTTSGEKAGFLPDYSGNRNHFKQIASNKKPLIVPNGKNSKAVLRFDGADDFMQCINQADNFKFLSSGPSTLFVVHKPWTVADPNALGYLFDNITQGASIGSRTGFYLRPDDRAAFSFNDNMVVVVSNNTGGGSVNIVGTTASNGVAPANTWSINVLRLDPGNVTGANRLFLSRNGGAEFQGNASTGVIGSGGPTFQMALGGASGDGLNTYSGDLAAFVVFPSLLSTTNISAILSSLNSDWNIY
jgi:hypothetical protein